MNSTQELKFLNKIINQLQVAVISGLVVMILLFPLNAYIATKLRNYQIIQMKRKDERVKMMNETLNGIKVSALYLFIQTIL